VVEIEASRHTLQIVELLPVLMQAIKIVKQNKIDMEIDIKFEFSDENYIIKADEFLIDIFENILVNYLKRMREAIDSGNIEKFLKDQLIDHSDKEDVEKKLAIIREL